MVNKKSLSEIVTNTRLDISKNSKIKKLTELFYKKDNFFSTWCTTISTMGGFYLYLSAYQNNIEYLKNNPQLLEEALSPMIAYPIGAIGALALGAIGWMVGVNIDATRNKDYAVGFEEGY